MCNDALFLNFVFTLDWGALCHERTLDNNLLFVTFFICIITEIFKTPFQKKTVRIKDMVLEEIWIISWLARHSNLKYNKYRYMLICFDISGHKIILKKITILPKLFFVLWLVAERAAKSSGKPFRETFIQVYSKNRLMKLIFK